MCLFQELTVLWRSLSGNTTVILLERNIAIPQNNYSILRIFVVMWNPFTTHPPSIPLFMVGGRGRPLIWNSESDNAVMVHVDPPRISLPHQQQQLLDCTVPPLEEDDNFGISLYLRAVQTVQQFLSSRICQCYSDIWFPGNCSNEHYANRYYLFPWTDITGNVCEQQ